jgi:hypothetical protein
MNNDIRKNELAIDALRFNYHLAELAATPVDTLPSAFETQEQYEHTLRQIAEVMREIHKDFEGVITIGLEWGFEDLTMSLDVRIRVDVDPLNPNNQLIRTS